jgi:uncharacterized protein YkwD
MLEYKIKQNIVRYFTLSVMVIFFGICNVHFIFASEVQKDDTLINTVNVIEFVNKERTESGLEALQENELLDTVAQKKLDDMLKEDYFAHTSPEGIDPWQWFFDAGYDFAYAGENLATEYTNVIKQHEAWMNSPKHRKNILDERFTHTGVAVGHKKIDGKDVVVTVQVFATPQKISVTSPNFTPDTFEVPDALFYKGTKDISSTIDETNDNLQDVPVLQAETKNVYSTNQGNTDVDMTTRQFAWIVIGIITFFVVLTEYLVFRKKQKRS